MAIQQAKRATGSIDPELIEQLKAAIRGQVIQEGEEGYDLARALWNGMHDRRPSVVVRPMGVADVMATVVFARDHDQELAIKGGGHNVAGNAARDGAMLLDMSSMRGVRVDLSANTAYVQGGATWGDFDHETAAFNLTTTGGVVSTTGVAGLTLGGGIGWLNPKFGASCDNVLAYDVVLADGSYVRATADENPDLFWALKGGGGNFGVVTGFVFQLHPFNHHVLAGARFYPMDRARETIGFYRDFTRKTSRDVVVYAALWLNPGTGETACGIAFCHSGDMTAAEAEMAPVRNYGDADLDIIAPMPYTAWQQAFDPLLPYGRNYYWKALLFTEFTDAALDVIAEHGSRKPNPISYAVLEQFGGAYGDVGKSDTAFRHRDIRHQVVIGGAWEDPADKDACIRWVRAFHDALAPHAAEGRNLNFTVVEEQEKADRIRASYGENFDKLVQVKTKYDPTNFFHINNNIKPSV